MLREKHDKGKKYEKKIDYTYNVLKVLSNKSLYLRSEISQRVQHGCLQLLP